MKIELHNGYIMVEEIKRTATEQTLNSGFIIPEQQLEDEQTSQGRVVESCVDEYKIGDVLFFHKMLPIDVSLRLSSDSELKPYFFLQQEDVICKIIDE